MPRQKDSSRESDNQNPGRFLEYACKSPVPSLSSFIDDGKYPAGTERFRIIIIEFAHHRDVSTVDEGPGFRTDIRSPGMPDEEYENIEHHERSQESEYEPLEFRYISFEEQCRKMRQEETDQNPSEKREYRDPKYHEE